MYNLLQNISNYTKIHIYLIYTYKNKPTTTYKLFMPFNEAIKIKHYKNKLEDLETFAFKCSKKGLIFFTRMEKYPQHIDPLMLNYERCFNNEKRNTKRAIYPSSKQGECLINSIKAELKRKSIDFEKMINYI